jgi:Mce-associated membrane protein
MTTTPHPTRRRATGIRRPRVAGHTPGRPTPTAPADNSAAAANAADASTAAPAGIAAAPADATAPADPGAPADAGPANRRPSGKGVLRGRAPGGTLARNPAGRSTSAARLVAVRRRPVPLPALVGALVLLLGLAVFFAVEDAQVRGTPSAQNTALVDIGTTAEVSQQVAAALKTVYSFDYTRLDQNEAAARAVITPAFADQFDQLFRQVRELAPQQQAVVTATVNLVGVQSINGDTAILLVFLDQQATRAQAGAGPQQLAAAGRLTVTAQRTDGTWKIAGVDPR